MTSDEHNSEDSVSGTKPGEEGAFAGAPADTSIPAWVASDWLFAVVACLGAFLVIAVVSALVGMINSFVLTGSVSAAVQGAIAGLFLSFSSFGVESAVGIGSDNIVIAYGTRYLPLAWLVLFLAVMWMAFRYCHGRSEATLTNRRALVVKLALVVGVFAATAAALLTFGDPLQSGVLVGGFNDSLVSTVDSGTAFLYGFFFTAMVGVVFHQRTGTSILAVPDRLVENPALRNGGADVMQGAKTCLVALVAFGALALVAGFIIADTMRDRVLLVTGFPFHLGNLGASAETIAMGGAVEYAANPDGHVSLMNWAWGDGAGERAPLYFFAILLVTPALIFWRITNYLDERGAHDESDLLGAGIRFAAGFTFTSWVFGWLGRVNLGAFGSDAADPIGGDFDPVKAFEFAPSLRAAFGLALLWSVAGSLVAALLWGQRRGLKLFSSLSSVSAPPSGESTTF